MLQCLGSAQGDLGTHGAREASRVRPTGVGQEAGKARVPRSAKQQPDVHPACDIRYRKKCSCQSRHTQYKPEAGARVPREENVHYRLTQHNKQAGRLTTRQASWPPHSTTITLAASQHKQAGHWTP
jgi:hypothetical protein